MLNYFVNQKKNFLKDFLHNNNLKYNQFINNKDNCLNYYKKFILVKNIEKDYYFETFSKNNLNNFENSNFHLEEEFIDNIIFPKNKLKSNNKIKNFIKINPYINKNKLSLKINKKRNLNKLNNQEIIYRIILRGNITIPLFIKIGDY